MALTFLVEIGCLIAGVQSTLRYSWAARERGYQTWPGDTPASEPYRPKLVGCTFRYDASGDAIRLGQGQIVLQNTDGALDALLDYVYDSQTAKLFIVDENAAYTTVKELARWTVEQPSDGNQRVTLVTHTPIYNLDKTLQTVRYGGTGGVDGGSDLANKPKPAAWGSVLNAKPVLVDAVKLIHQFASSHDLASIMGAASNANIFAVRDEGVALSQGADYTSVADMNANAPTGADDFRVCNAVASGSGNNYGVYIRLQSSPVGELTFDGQFYPAALSDTTLAMLTGLSKAASSGAQVYSADRTAVTAAFGYACQFFFGSDRDPATYLDALQQILTGLRGWMVPYQAAPTQYPPDGYTPPWAVRWLDTPATAAASPYGNDLLGPVASVTPFLSIDGSRITSPLVRRAEYEFGWPEFRTTIKYDHLAYVQTQGFAGAVSAADRARYALEYLSASDEDLSVLTSFPTAVDRTVTTAFTSITGTIGNEATRQLGVFSDHHPAFEVSARVDLYHGLLTVPGDPMTIVNYPRHGCDVSRRFMILGMERDYLAFDEGANTIGFSATLWG